MPHNAQILHQRLSTWLNSNLWIKEAAPCKSALLSEVSQNGPRFLIRGCLGGLNLFFFGSSPSCIWRVRAAGQHRCWKIIIFLCGKWTWAVSIGQWTGPDPGARSSGAFIADSNFFLNLKSLCWQWHHFQAPMVKHSEVNHKNIGGQVSRSHNFQETVN